MSLSLTRLTGPRDATDGRILAARHSGMRRRCKHTRAARLGEGTVGALLLEPLAAY